MKGVDDWSLKRGWGDLKTPSRWTRVGRHWDPFIASGNTNGSFWTPQYRSQGVSLERGSSRVRWGSWDGKGLTYTRRGGWGTTGKGGGDFRGGWVGSAQSGGGVTGWQLLAQVCNALPEGQEKQKLRTRRDRGGNEEGTRMSGS
eukprot:765337-Hanusia_phi.AAC.5